MIDESSDSKTFSVCGFLGSQGFAKYDQAHPGENDKVLRMSFHTSFGTKCSFGEENLLRASVVAPKIAPSVKKLID